MRYLKLVNSFDEFAEQAAPNTVYYHIQNNVYYWLNLRSIWGYVGFDSSTNTFVSNGMPYSIIPSVPDPESLLSPVIINENSFPINYIPETLLFKNSAFSIFPIFSFFGPGSSESQRIRYIIECDNLDIPYEITFSGRYVDVILKNADLFVIKEIGHTNGTYHRLIVNDDTLLLDINCDAYKGIQAINYRETYFVWRCEKDIDVLTEDSLFANIPASLENINQYNDWYNTQNQYARGYPHIVDCSNFNNIKISLHSLYDLSVPAFYPYNVPNLANIIIDAQNADGKIDDDLYTKWLGATDTTTTKRFGNIEYQNVENYGTYYKPFQTKQNAELIPADILALAKTKEIEIYSYNVITDITSWASVVSQNIDLTGYDSFVYYIDGYPTISRYGTAIPFTDYSQFVQNGAQLYSIDSYKIPVASTPKLSNINLKSYGGFSSANSSDGTYVYFNTDDSQITLGILKLRKTGAYIYVADKDIYINGVQYLNGTANFIYLYFGKYDSIGSGIVHLKHFPTDNPNRIIQLYISNSSHVAEYEIIDVSELIDSATPNALDYYNTGITMRINYAKYKYVNGFITRDLITADEFNPIPAGVSSKFKCIAGGGEFYSNRSTLVNATDMENLFNAIPNKTVQNLTLSFSEAQFALLTQEQIDYATGLGYSVVKHIG